MSQERLESDVRRNFLRAKVTGFSCKMQVSVYANNYSRETDDTSIEFIKFL